MLKVRHLAQALAPASAALGDVDIFALDLTLRGPDGTLHRIHAEGSQATIRGLADELERAGYHLHLEGKR